MKRYVLTVLVLGVLAGTGCGVLWLKKAADARSLEHIVIEPAPPQPKLPRQAVSLDPRLAGLLPRTDGARMLYAPEAGTRLLSAAFIDDHALLLTASAGDGKEARWELARLDIDSSSSTLLMTGNALRLASSHRPAFQPRNAGSVNAGRLCYSERDAKRGVFEIWCADAAGRNPKQVTRHDGKEDLLSPALSPDGEWIAFEVVAERSKPQGSAIWKIRADGAELEQLTRGADDRKPTWSDDGRRLYFQHRPIGGSASWDVYAMDADGGNAAPLLRTYEEDETFPARRASTDEFLMIESTNGAAPRLKRIQGTTKSGTYLTDGKGGPESSLSISPDGAVIAFLAPASPDHPEALAVWLLPLGS